MPLSISLFESCENTIVEFFFFYLSKWEHKKYISCSLSFTMATSSFTRKCEKGSSWRSFSDDMSLMDFQMQRNVHMWISLDSSVWKLLQMNLQRRQIASL